MPAVKTTPEQPAIPPARKLAGYNIYQLRKFCLSIGVPTYGRKAELITRLSTPESDRVHAKSTKRPPGIGEFDFIDLQGGHKHYAVPPQREAVLSEFMEHKLAKDISDGTANQHRAHLRVLEGFFALKDYPEDFRYKEIKKRDCTRFKNWLNRDRNYKPRSINSIVITIRDFLRFALTGRTSGIHPDITDTLSIKRGGIDKQSDNVREITYDEYVALRNELPKMRDKVVLAVLYDSGCRKSEVFNLQVRDFKSDSYGTYISVDGKTGPRDVQLVESVHDLRSWINAFPARINKDAYLFGNPLNRYSKPLSEGTFKHHYYPAVRRLGFQGEITPHTFRHNRALQFAKAGVQEEVMRGHFGWGKGSEMPSYYIRLASKDIRAAVLKAQGQDHLLPPDEDGNGKANTTPCASCGSYQPLTNAYCSVCGGGLSVEAKAKSGDTLSFLNNLPPEQHTKATQLARMLLNASEDPETKGLLEGLKESLAPGKGWQPAESS